MVLGKEVAGGPPSQTLGRGGAGVSVLSSNQIAAQQRRNTTALNYKGPPSDYLQLKNGNQICLAEEKFSPREIEIAAAMGAEIAAPPLGFLCRYTGGATLRLL